MSSFEPLHPSLMLMQGDMNEEETTSYLHARMCWAGLEEHELAVIDSEAINQIDLRSGGVPRRVHTIASSFFESVDSGLPPELSQKRKRENWMGQPIEADR